MKIIFLKIAYTSKKFKYWRKTQYHGNITHNSNYEADAISFCEAGKKLAEFVLMNEKAAFIYFLFLIALYKRKIKILVLNVI